MTYLSDQEIVDYVASEIAGDLPFLRRCVAAAEAAVNDYCRRAFNPPAVTSITRYYRTVTDVVYVHDFIDTTNLTIADNGAAVALADVQLEPLNNLSAAGLVVPFCRLRRLSGYWSQPTSPSHATIAVTSTRWGWLAVPAPVKEATAVLAKDLAHVKGTRFGVAGFDGFGAVRVRDNPHVKMMLDRPDLRHPSRLMAFA